MNRATKIRQVYTELRREIGDRLPAHEVLSSAVHLVGLYEPAVVEPASPGRPRFEELPVDKAFEDGGWRVMRYEASRLAPILYDQSMSRCDAGALVSRRMEQMA